MSRNESAAKGVMEKALHKNPLLIRSKGSAERQREGIFGRGKGHEHRKGIGIEEVNLSFA